MVNDNKSGWAKVPPVGINWQVRSGGALKAEELDALELVCTLTHPHDADSLYEARVYTRAESDRLLDTTRHLNQQIQLPDQRRIPGGIQCEWCEAKRVCPEFKAFQADLRQSVADEIRDEGFTAINRRSAEERGEHVRVLKQAKMDIDFLLEQYVELAERDPSSIAGYRLAHKFDRSVTSEVDAMEKTKKAWGQDVLYAALKFSVAELEEAVQKQSKGTKKEAKAALERVLGPLLKFKKSKNFLEEARSI
jgi:hypothetical protein